MIVGGYLKNKVNKRKLFMTPAFVLDVNFNY